MIHLEKIVKNYALGKQNLRVLQGITLDFKKGEMVAIMGASGSGKTTLLNVIGLLDKPTSGDYLLEGKEVSRLGSLELARIRGQKIGFIFQTFNLLSYLSAYDNVKLGQRYARINDPQRARDALEQVGLAGRLRHRPAELSGGEQQRVAIARVLAKNPPLILADEPTGNLDSHSGKEIMTILTGLHAEKGITLIMVTHDVNIARYCQRIITIKDGQILSDQPVVEKVAA
jgi:putative ABC transport system ATP-binding protein